VKVPFFGAAKGGFRWYLARRSYAGYFDLAAFSLAQQLDLPRQGVARALKRADSLAGQSLTTRAKLKAAGGSRSFETRLDAAAAEFPKALREEFAGTEVIDPFTDRDLSERCAHAIRNYIAASPDDPISQKVMGAAGSVPTVQSEWRFVTAVIGFGAISAAAAGLLVTTVGDNNTPTAFVAALVAGLAGGGITLAVADHFDAIALQNARTALSKLADGLFGPTLPSWSKLRDQPLGEALVAAVGEVVVAGSPAYQREFGLEQRRFAEYAWNWDGKARAEIRDAAEDVRRALRELPGASDWTPAMKLSDTLDDLLASFDQADTRASSAAGLEQTLEERLELGVIVFDVMLYSAVVAGALDRAVASARTKRLGAGKRPPRGGAAKKPDRGETPSSGRRWPKAPRKRSRDTG
jgi:hypothetical protein